jgi:hypothetical protein
VLDSSGSIRGEITYGLLADVVECVGGGVNDLTLDLVGPTSIVPQATSGSRYIDVLGHAEGLAVVQSLNWGEEVGILLEEIRKLDQKPSAVLGCLLSPWAVEGFAGSSYGNVDILLGSLLNSADDLLGGGVDDVKCLAVNRLDEFVVDEPVSALEHAPSLEKGASEACRKYGGRRTGQWAAHTRPSEGS